MTRMPARLFLLAMILVGTGSLYASGPIGIYGMIEKVVFEPGEQSPQRVQVWGSFAYSDGAGVPASAVSPIRRGYLYFYNPTGSDIVVKEWRDLNAVAGTDQAVAFGQWLYIGAFEAIRPEEKSLYGIYMPNGGFALDLRVRPFFEPLANPAEYATNTGVVKLSVQGNYVELVRKLKAALKQQ